MADEVRETYPLQATARSRPTLYASCNRHVYLAAYEVYSYVYGEQKALLEGGCRGGFGPCEMIAYLYARSFPRVEWAQRVDEALVKMDIK